ncbi:MAG TPA: hypothetical protein PLE75_05400 [Ferruginibacter sp.]|nr:hypothetical protein [Ferruginibacter sp.]HRO06102.1 hypothetical protein [Ferruginibacter sp.]HRO96824.1 hypothetical protein [Ferruginibacter sp.]HRP50397.1 hypothetical protein [Ferruginibacter sp.]
MSFAKNVFINCPFDRNYIDDILKPILYVLIRNGYSPRLSLEVSDSGQVRLQKITEIIKSCKYSIHDLSIVKSKKPDEFARMNMPFELGIDYGLRNSGLNPLRAKKFLILEANKYDYMKAISDINGFDVKVHSNDTKKVFDCLYSWSSETLKINGQDPPLKMFYDFTDFNTSLFDEKVSQFNSDDIAKDYIEKISIPEYIDEIKERI